MAEINLGNESNINVDLTTDTPISTNLPDINYIPGYVEAEEQRRTNEEERISNEEEREELYNEVKTKLQNGELNGRDGVRQYTAGAGIKIENDIISNTRDSVNWGKVQGDISNQTDLKNALDSKADTDDIPTNLSDLTNDEGFINNTVNNLVNYYLKNDLYTKSEVDTLISAIQGFKVEIVQTLPVSDIDTHTIYLKSSVDPKTQNVYDEFIYVNNNWEQIGSTAIDLTNYYTKTQVNDLLNNKQNTLVSGTNVKTINDESILGSGNIPIEIPEVYVGTSDPSTNESLQYVKLWINPNEVARGSGFELNKIYPIGAIYINTTGVNPSTFLGGTWQPFGKGKVLVGQDEDDADFDILGLTGGNKTNSHYHLLPIIGDTNNGNFSFVQWNKNFGYPTQPITTPNKNALNNTPTAQAMDGYQYGSNEVEVSTMQPYIVVSMWVRIA